MGDAATSQIEEENRRVEGVVTGAKVQVTAGKLRESFI